MPDAARRDTGKQWLVAILIWAFLGTWIYVFSFSLYASGCRKFDNPAQERLGKCKNSLRFTGFLYSEYQRSENLRMQGIALAELGRIEESYRTFEESIKVLMPSHAKAPNVVTRVLREPVREMNNPELPPKAQELWKRALLSFMERY